MGIKNFTTKQALFQRILDLKSNEKTTQNNATNLNLKTLNPLILAHIGDAYFSLYVREKILSFGEIKIKDLHNMSAEIVSAESQKKAYDFLEKSFLTEEEKEIFRRGKNAKSHGKKNASSAVYHASTGFEALIGYIYLKKNFNRLEEITEKTFWFITENKAENND